MAQNETVYDHIWKNNLKTVFLIFLFVAMAMGVVWCVIWIAVYLSSSDGDFILRSVQTTIDIFPDVAEKVNETNRTYYATLGYFVISIIPTILFSIAWLTYIYFFGEQNLLFVSRAEEAPKQEYRRLYTSVESVAIMAGLPTPKVYIIDDDSMNAFTTGTRSDNAAMVFSKGIIKSLTPLELEGVIAHEMSHIGNHDLLLNLILIEGIDIFNFLSDSARAFTFEAGTRIRKPESFITLLSSLLSLCFRFISCVISPVIYVLISRTREYNADATGAKILHNPKALADALHKIGLDPRIERLGQAFASICIVDHRHSCAHLAKGGILSTHPPIRKRIQRLRSMI